MAAREVLGLDEGHQQLLRLAFVFHSEPHPAQVVSRNLVVIVLVRDLVQAGVYRAQGVGTCNDKKGLID